MTHGHGHGHGHDHGHDRPADFDWDVLAGSLELDAAITMPIVLDVSTRRTPHLDWGSVQHVLDVGCGPGAVAVALCRQAPNARVTALDSSTQLLGRVRQKAVEMGLDDRVWTVAGDLEAPLPAMPPADVVWASMVLHHVTDPVATLRRLAGLMPAGGTLVMVEFGNQPTVLPADDPLRTSGTWARFQQATAASLNERLGLDPVAVDWPSLLCDAGFVDVTDEPMAAHHPSPLGDLQRAWLDKHLRRGVDMAGDRLTPADAAALADLADAVPRRDDLFVHAERRVLVARTPS